MYTINETFTFTQDIKKSTFICTLIPVSSIDNVNKELKSIRKKYYDATHNCYSYIITNSDGTQSIKASDDGEPSQTAGVVILDVLQKNTLTNVLAVVTRYFGGIKLGAGGLVRAYSSSTSEAVKTANIIEIVKKNVMHIIIDYQYVNEILKLCKDYEIIEQLYDIKVSLKYLIPEKMINNLQSRIIDLTKNGAIINVFNK